MYELKEKMYEMYSTINQKKDKSLKMMKSFIKLCERNYPFFNKHDAKTLITTASVAGTVF